MHYYTYKYFFCFRIQDIVLYQRTNCKKYLIEFGNLKLAIPIHQLHDVEKTFYESGVEGVILGFRTSLLHLDKDNDEWTNGIMAYTQAYTKFNGITKLRAILCSDLCKQLEVIVQFNETDPKIWIFETKDESERRALFSDLGRREEVLEAIDSCACKIADVRTVETDKKTSAKIQHGKANEESVLDKYSELKLKFDQAKAEILEKEEENANLKITLELRDKEIEPTNTQPTTQHATNVCLDDSIPNPSDQFDMQSLERKLDEALPQVMGQDNRLLDRNSQLLDQNSQLMTTIAMTGDGIILPGESGIGGSVNEDEDNEKGST